MKTFKFLAAGVVFLAMLSCSNNADTPEDPEPEPGPVYDETYFASVATIGSSDSHFTATEDGGTVLFATEGGRISIDVTCGTEWDAECDPEGLFEIETNEQAGTLTVTAGQNTEEKDLTATITLATSESGIEFASVEVIQTAYDAPKITADITEWTVPAVGELTTHISVEANMDWEVGNENSWLTAEKTDGGLDLTASENQSPDGRSGEITLYCSDGLMSASYTVTVTQDARAYITLSTAKMSFGGNGGTASVTVESNYDWAYSSDSTEGWLSVSRSEGGLTATADANESSSAREATITLTAGDGAENVIEAVVSVTQTIQSIPLILIYKTTSENTTIRVPLYGEVNCIVDWGDGSDAATVSGTNPSQPTHTYADAGEHEVSVSGTLTAINNQSNPTSVYNYLTGVKQWGTTGLTSMEYAFYSCSNLTTIPSDKDGSFADVTTFKNAFYKCSALSEIPEGLFGYCDKVTDFTACFYSNSTLTLIPKGLFDNCPEVTAFSNTFSGCSSLEAIPEGLFANCAKVTKCPSMFNGCKALTSVDEDIFSTFTEVTTFASVFYNCTALKSVPENLFENCRKVTIFNMAFYGCTALKCESPYAQIEVDGQTVDVHLYERADYGDYFSDPTSHTKCFYNCTNLTDKTAITSAGWN